MRNRIHPSLRSLAAFAVIALALPSAGRADDVESAATTPSVLGLWKTVDDKTGEVRSIARLYEKEGRIHGCIERTRRA